METNPSVARLYGNDNVVRMFGGDSMKEGKISSNWVHIEIYPNRCEHYILPIGIKIDGIELTQQVVCRFIKGNYTVDGVTLLSI